MPQSKQHTSPGCCLSNNWLTSSWAGRSSLSCSCHVDGRAIFAHQAVASSVIGVSWRGTKRSRDLRLERRRRARNAVECTRI